MSFEAVPYMFRSTTGANGETQYLGILIRPSGNAQTQGQSSSNAIQGPSTSGALIPTSKGNAQPLMVPLTSFRQGGPITVGTDAAAKILVPTKVQVRLSGSDASLSTAPVSQHMDSEVWSAPGRSSTSFSSPAHSFSPAQIRSGSACSASPLTDCSPLSPNLSFGLAGTSRTAQERLRADGVSWSSGAGVSDSSTTPDSGIQSTPTSPAGQAQPLTPPSLKVEGSVCEERAETDNEEDYADMPRLLPANQTLEDENGAAAGSSDKREDSASAHGSECETGSVPSFSITRGMDSNQIVDHLLQLDPKKAAAIANLIRRKTAGSNKRMSDASAIELIELELTNDKKRRRSVEPLGSAERFVEALEVAKCREEVRRSDDERLSSEPIAKEDEEAVVEPDPKTDRRTYREAVNRMLQRKNIMCDENGRVRISVPYLISKDKVQVSHILDETISNVASIHIEDDEREKMSRNRNCRGVFAIDWDAVKKRGRAEPHLKFSSREFLDVKSGRLPKAESLPRRSTSRTEKLQKVEVKSEQQRIEQRNLRKRVDHKEEKVSVTAEVKEEPAEQNGRGPGRKKKKSESQTVEPEKEVKPTQDIKKSVGRPSRKRRSSETTSIASKEDTVRKEKDKSFEYSEVTKSFCENSSLAGWESESPQCGCTRGACTSDAECVNRALCVQCPANCLISHCANKKFWRDDVVRQLRASGPETKRTLRTRSTRRDGEFLGEFSGEVITFDVARKRYKQYLADKKIPRILALTARLFVDATLKGNIVRYVRHSCQPNSRLEVCRCEHENKRPLRSVGGVHRAGLFSLYELGKDVDVTLDMNRLLPETTVCECTLPNCRKIIRASPNALIAHADDLPLNEECLVLEKRLFLLRNRERAIRAAKSVVPALAEPKGDALADLMKKVYNGVQYRIRAVDGSLRLQALHVLSRVSQVIFAVGKGHLDDFEGSEAFESSMDKLLNHLDDDDIDRCYRALRERYLEETFEKIRNKKDRKRESGGSRLLNRQMDLTYLSSAQKVGSYNPDDAWPRGKAKEGDDAVRCTCGSLEEDGEMLQCDVCHFWLHSDCVTTVVDNNTEYQCAFCQGNVPELVPSTDVVLPKLPEIRLEGCKYFKALVNRRSMQVRLNEAIYVEKDIGEEHKKILRRMQECGDKKKEKTTNGGKLDLPKANMDPLPKQCWDRKDLRVFRVERLFSSSQGHRFVFGFYYARPHETFCDSQRIFHKNEVFATPFYDTLPLDSVVGRCCVLDAAVWSTGRPTTPRFIEDDVFVCEYQIDKAQRAFTRVPNGARFPTNTQPYVFNLFDRVRPLQRTFTPFLGLADRCVSSASGSRCSSRAVDDQRRERVYRTIQQKRLESVVERIQQPSKEKVQKAEKKIEETQTVEKRRRKKKMAPKEVKKEEKAKIEQKNERNSRRRRASITAAKRSA